MNDLQHIPLPPVGRPSAVPARRARHAQRGFSITELLVVIGIIVLLAGLLLAALRTVRTSALVTSTTSTMQSFASACDAFYAEHGHYPGVIPEHVLALQPTTPSGATFTSTQNALLHLMGGYRVLRPGEDVPGHPAWVEYDSFQKDREIVFTVPTPGGNQDWKIKINHSRIGEGPVIDGKPYAPYFTPGPREVASSLGKVQQNGEPDDLNLPDLIDAWGQPIIYLRQSRTMGRIVGEPGDRPQFYLGTGNGWGAHRAYMESKRLGEFAETQVENPPISTWSILNDPGVDRVATLAQIIRHPAFGLENVNPADNSEFSKLRARGAYVLISAGPDGIFFSRFDGPGSPTTPVNVQADIIDGHPKVIDEFDDIRVFGGG